MQQQRFSVADFYARRVRRIFPALSIVMGACLLFGWFALFPDEYQALGNHALGGAAVSTSSCGRGRLLRYGGRHRPLLHLWSLAVEEQFYLIWPPLLMLAFRWRWKPWRVALALAALSFVLNVAGVHHHATATFYSPASRIWCCWARRWPATRWNAAPQAPLRQRQRGARAQSRWPALACWRWA
jgi:peptidoglycan/LPS O-acetylase OafA/YrhL